MGPTTKKHARRAKKSSRKAKRSADNGARRKPSQPELGRRCKELRLARGLPQFHMVHYVGFSLSHYQKIERGLLDCQLSTLQRLAKTFGLSLSEFLDGVSNDPNEGPAGA